MNARDQYAPGPATGARVLKQGEDWTLLIVRELSHPPSLVWAALTEPKHLTQWAPFDADRSLDGVGPVELSAARAPTPQVSQGTVKHAEAPRLLEYDWGGQNLRWELEPTASGTRLSLYHNINRRYIA